MAEDFLWWIAGVLSAPLVAWVLLAIWARIAPWVMFVRAAAFDRLPQGLPPADPRQMPQDGDER